MVTTKDILLAISTAVLTALFIWVYEEIASRRRRKTIRKLINLDLSHLLELFPHLEREYLALNKILVTAGQQIQTNKENKRRLEMSYRADSFEQLSAVIYQSIPKTDLFETFGSRLITLNTIYTEIGFLSTHKPVTMYTSAANDLQDLAGNEANVLAKLESTALNCQNNVEAIVLVRGKIRSLFAANVFK